MFLCKTQAIKENDYSLSQSEEEEDDDEKDLDLYSTIIQYTKLVDGCLKTEYLEIEDKSEIEPIILPDTKYKIDVDGVR